MKPSEVLQKAHDRLSVPGVWGKGPKLPQGCTCIALVTAEIVGGTSKGRPDIDADEYVRKVIGIPEGLLDEVQTQEFTWNDAPERTLPEVLAVLLKARDLALADGQ